MTPITYRHLLRDIREKRLPLATLERHRNEAMFLCDFFRADHPVMHDYCRHVARAFAWAVRHQPREGA